MTQLTLDSRVAAGVGQHPAIPLHGRPEACTGHAYGHGHYRGLSRRRCSDAMNMLQPHPKITPRHLQRKAMVYLRQSSDRQVQRHTESQRLQYDFAARAQALGFAQVDIIEHGSRTQCGHRSRATRRL